MKLIFCFLFPSLIFLGTPNCQAQSDEVAQLLLNVTKLSQLKQILSDLEKGYTTLRTGYAQIENLASGNFSLHETFLNSLLQVSPAVKNYHKVAQIIQYQTRLIKDYRLAFSQFKSTGQLTLHELTYLSKVYGNLLDKSLQQINDLALILTSGKMRMSDEERLKAIDLIHSDLQDMFHFLNSFNQDTQVLIQNRIKGFKQIQGTQVLHSIKDPEL